jgi:hypothetical protein
MKIILKELWTFSKIFLLVCHIGNSSYAQSLSADEYQVKAVFLLNFANFVTWSETPFTHQEDPFYICVFGENPFNDSLDIAVENAKVENHSVKTRYPVNINEITPCHVLFINRSEEKNLSTILQVVKNQAILTVSDMENFVIRGGMIQFFKYGKKEKIRFSIDPITIAEANLRVSANLLRIANIIDRPYSTQ